MLNLTASEPLGGQVIQLVEGNPGGVLCDPADSPSVSCAWAAGGEGSFTIEFWAVSSYGDTSEKRFARWVQDSVAPSASIAVSDGIQGGGGWYRAGPLTARAVGSDATSGVASQQVALAGGPWTPQVSISSEGVHAVQTLVTDNAGNTSSSSATVKLDNTPPTMQPSLSGPTGLNGWYTGAVTASVAGADSLSGVAARQVKVDSNPWGSSPVTVSADGVHTVAYLVRDLAGNETSGGESAVRIDGTAPELSHSMGGVLGQAGWYRTPVRLDVSASDATSGVGAISVRVDSQGWQTTNSVDIGEGVHQVEMRALDQAGNIALTTAVVRVDPTPPEIAIQETGDSPNGSGWYRIAPVTLVIQSADATSGIASNEYRIVPGSWGPGSSITVLEDGIRTLEARAHDIAGNQAVASHTVKLDTAPPESSFSSPPEGASTWVSGVVQVQGTSSDSLSGIQHAEFSLDGGKNWTTQSVSNGFWSHSWDTRSGPGGEYNLRARATDLAGNLGAAALASVMVDNDPPVVDLPASWALGSLAKLAVSDHGIGLDRVEITITGNGTSFLLGEYEATKIPAAIQWNGKLGDGSIAGPGKYVVVVVAWDKLGNEGSDQGTVIVGSTADDEPVVIDPSDDSEPTIRSTPISELGLRELFDRSREIPSEETEGGYGGFVDPAEPVGVLEIESGPSRQETGSLSARKHLWIWPTLTWLGLLGGIAYSKLTDPRPGALKRLRSDLEIIRKLNT